MSAEVNNEQTKRALQERTTELTDEQLDEVAGGDAELTSQGETEEASIEVLFNPAEVSIKRSVPWGE